MRIKEAARRLGISERMLRHYENEGLLRPRRSENGYRWYDEADLRRVARIRISSRQGFRRGRSVPWLHASPTKGLAPARPGSGSF